MKEALLAPFFTYKKSLIFYDEGFYEGLVVP